MASSWVEIGEQGIVANLCAAVKVTGAPDTEGPLRRLCGKMNGQCAVLGYFNYPSFEFQSLVSLIARIVLLSVSIHLFKAVGEADGLRILLGVSLYRDDLQGIVLEYNSPNLNVNNSFYLSTFAAILTELGRRKKCLSWNQPDYLALFPPCPCTRVRASSTEPMSS